ncbi:hypothetical protein EUTSA_v10028353mg [Eutrema salsugineum]|uniref:Uncharacterized protein n=1 Tax=Eutrema salsugineum TaxID=72664 RepID=V4NLX9_EUTSA|nr:hypothetical protein EUTSA_v10028353mg [Eutrema salsugineum]
MDQINSRVFTILIALLLLSPLFPSQSQGLSVGLTLHRKIIREKDGVRQIGYQRKVQVRPSGSRRGPSKGHPPGSPRI